MVGRIILCCCPVSVYFKSFPWRSTHSLTVLLHWVESKLLQLLLLGGLGCSRDRVHIDGLAQGHHLGAGVVLVLTRLSLAVVL